MKTFIRVLTAILFCFGPLVIHSYALELPTTLTMPPFDTTTPDMIQGALAGGSDPSKFFFNFGNPTAASFPSGSPSIVNIAYDCQVHLVRGDFLTGKVSSGDTVHVQAYYNIDAATELYSTPVSGYYSFPAGQAGISYEVNGFSWITTGGLTVCNEFDYIGFEGYTKMQHQLPNGVDIVTTQINGPGIINGQSDNFMLFLPACSAVPLPGAVLLLGAGLGRLGLYYRRKRTAKN